jgi:hypothetical protein
VVVHFKDGKQVEFPATTVTSVALYTAPRPEDPPVEHMLVRSNPETTSSPGEPGANPALRLDVSRLEQSDWKAVIAECKELGQLRSGFGSMTLMRVLLDDARPDDMVQLTSIKLTDPKEARAGGGGMFRQVRSGSFVLIEHINSTRRKDGMDPVQIASFTHQQTVLWVQVPPPGTLGVLGDVTLAPCPPDQMGLIEAAVEGDAGLVVRHFWLGTLVVGGSYGRTIAFDPDRKCNTGPIAAGSYRILLPDFDMVKSRWTVNVAPGMTTHLRFVARSQRVIDKLEESIVPLTVKSDGR